MAQRPNWSTHFDRKLQPVFEDQPSLQVQANPGQWNCALNPRYAFITATERTFR